MVEFQFTVIQEKTDTFNSSPIPEVKAIYKKNNDIVDEMEKRLTEYVRNNINELKD